MRFRLLGAVAMLALVAGCHSGSSAVSSGPSCLTGGAVSPDAAVSPDPAGGGAPGAVGGGSPAPSVALDCFSGSGKARLTDLHAPTIVTLWASWCVPCAKEMPAFQAIADKDAGRVRVVGVVTFDAHAHAQAFISDHKVSFPMLDDPDKRLLTAVGRNALPVTLFVTADGHLAHVYNDTALDEPTLASLASEYLGVTA